MAATTFISMIGSGNLAWHLAPALDNAGYAVTEVYSRNPAHARLLTERLYQAEVKATLDFSTSRSRIFIVATTDDAIHDIAREIILPDNAILVHTSGAQPLSLLGYAPTPDIGVFYPLQTFTKSKRIDFQEVPIFIECESPDAQKILMTMARAISRKVQRVTSYDRKAMHVAAVFASNFTNHMLTVAQEIMHENNLQFDWLKPLIIETVNKSLALGPDQAQTGPAVRGDFETLDHHLEFLSQDERLAELYRVISQHIIDRYND